MSRKRLNERNHDFSLRDEHAVAYDADLFQSQLPTLQKERSSCQPIVGFLHEGSSA